MKAIIKVATPIVALIILAFMMGAVYVVSEVEQVVVTQFGKPVGQPVTEAGLHFKLPLPFQKANYFDKRLIAWDGDPNQIPTRDKRYLWVDTTARWKIEDPLKFLESVGSEREAHAKLDNIINSAARDAITSQVLVEVIRNSNRAAVAPGQISEEGFNVKSVEKIENGREFVEGKILEKAQELVHLYGIKLIDVRIKRVDYVEDVRKKVYERMISERKRAAEEYRSEGQGKSAEIKGKKEKELKSITSEAYKKAQVLRGKADAEATAIYANAYSKDPEFYALLKTLETYRTTIGKGTTLLLTTESDYFRYLKKLEK